MLPATDKKVSVMPWFVFIENGKVAAKIKVGSFGYEIAEGHNFISGWCLKQASIVKGGQKFKRINIYIYMFFFLKKVRYTHLSMWKIYMI